MTITNFYKNLKKLGRPYICQLLTYTSPIWTLVELNQMILDFLLDAICGNAERIYWYIIK